VPSRPQKIPPGCSFPAQTCATLPFWARVKRPAGVSMKPLAIFVSGSLLGVCLTVAALYVKEPLSKRLTALLSRPRTTDTTRVKLALRTHEAVMGSDSAAATLVEFSDFQCRYCAIFRTKVFPQIKTKFIDPGKLRFIHRHLPLSMHRNAKVAAQAAVCAGDQGQYWALSDLMFSRSSCLECQGAIELSKVLELDRKSFEACLSSNAHMDEIEKDMESAEQLQIDGTPSFVLGRTTAHGVEGVVLRGLMPFAQFETQINAVLKSGSLKP